MAHRYQLRSKGGLHINDNNNNQSNAINEHIPSQKKPEVDLKVFECPICLSLPRGIIWNCSNGHIICNSCYETLEQSDNKCPSCRVSMFHKFRNIIAEKVLSIRQVNCKHNGCKRLILFSELASHEKSCGFKSVNCKFQTLGCKWKGCVKDQNKHQNKCKFKKININKFMQILNKANNKKKIYQMLANKYEQMKNISFELEDNNESITGFDDIQKVFKTDTRCMDDNGDELEIELYMFITKERNDNNNQVFYLRYQLSADCECNDNHFADIRLDFCIADFNEEFDIDPVEFETITDSRDTFVTEPLKLDRSTAIQMMRRSVITFKLCQLNTQHEYVY